MQEENQQPEESGQAEEHVPTDGESLARSLTPMPVSIATLLAELQQLIHSARERVAIAANAELSMLYWRVGERLRKEMLQEQRAAYGHQVVEAVATDLSTRFGKGESESPGWKKR